LFVIPSEAEESARSDSGEVARQGENLFESRMRSVRRPGVGNQQACSNRPSRFHTLSPLALRVDSSASLGMTNKKMLLQDLVDHADGCQRFFVKSIKG